MHATSVCLERYSPGSMLISSPAMSSGILYGKKKARYRVVWVRYDELGDKMQAAVHRLESDACPWLDLLTEETAESSPPTDHPTP